MTEAPPSSGDRLGWVPRLLLLTAALQLAAAVRLPIALDEAYYWTWSKALAASYYDHPPGIAYVHAVSRRLLGEGWLGLRAVSLGAAVLTVALLWRAATEASATSPTRAGRMALLACLGAPMLTIGYLPLTPDPLQGALLALAAWSVGRAVRGQAWAGAVAVGAFGAAVLCKHSSALVAVGALVGAAATPAGRRALSRPATVLAALGALAAVGSWLLADLGPDGATPFQAARVLTGRPSRGLLGLPLTAGALALTVGPASAFGLAAAWRGALRPARDPAETVWAGGAFTLVLGCVVAAGFGAGELNWLMPGFAFGAPAAVGYAGRLGPTGARRWVAVTGLSIALTLVVSVHIVYPFLPIPARKDRTLRAVGFEEVARVADQLAARHGARVIVTSGYQTASQLRFQMRDARPVLETGSHRRSQYDRWPHPSVCPGDAVLVARARRDLPQGLEAEPLGPVTTVERIRNGRMMQGIFMRPWRVTASRWCAPEAE